MWTRDRIVLQSEIWYHCKLVNTCIVSQVLHSEVLSLEPAHAELVSLGMSLYPTAPDDRISQLKDDLETLQRRLHLQNEVLPQRYSQRKKTFLVNLFIVIL